MLYDSVAKVWCVTEDVWRWCDVGGDDDEDRAVVVVRALVLTVSLSFFSNFEKSKYDGIIVFP